MVNIWKEMKDVERKKESLKMSQHKKNENTRQRPLDPVKMENEAESVKDKETGSTSRLSNIRESDETDSSASSATSVTSEIASMFVEEILDQAMGNINELMQSISRWEAEEQPKSEADDKSSAACCSRQLQRFFSLRRVFAEHQGQTQEVTQEDMVSKMFSTPGTVAEAVTPKGVMEIIKKDKLVTAVDSSQDDEDVCKSSPAVSTQTSSDSERTDEKSSDRHGSKMYKKIKSVLRRSFRWRQKKKDHLEEKQDLDEASGSDSSDKEAGSPCPEETSPTDSMRSGEDLRDATKADLSSAPLERLGVDEEDVMPEKKPSKPSSKLSTTSSSPPAEHRKERSPVTEKDLYRDSTPGTVADKDVTPKGVMESFIEDNLVTEMDAKSKDIHLVRPGTPFLREMSFIKMDSPSQEDDKDVCKSSPTVSTQGPCDSDRTEEKSADRHGSKMYKKIKSIWKHSFRWRQKKTDHLEEQDSDEAGGSDSSDSSDMKPGSPRPEEKSPTGSMCSSEDIRDATKSDLYSVTLERVDEEDENVAPEEKPSKLSSKPSITSSSPSSEHHTERSLVTEKDLYRDSTPGTVADKDVTPKGLTQSFIEDNLVTEMDAKSKDIHLTRPGSPFLREMSFTKMDSPSQEDDKDVCKSSPPVSTQGSCDSERTEEKSADRHGSKMYKKIKSIWKHSFRSRQKKMDHLETDPDLDETGGSDSSDLKSGSPRPEEKSPTGSMCSSEDIRDATKSDQRSVPLEEVDKVDEDVAPEEKPSKLSSKPSITSSSPPAEHHTEKSSVTDKDLYRDSTPGTVADKDVTPKGLTQSFIEDNLVTEMDAKSKDIHLVTPGSPILREMSFTKMDSPSQEDDKDVCKSSPTVSTQGPCDSERTEEKSADRHGSKMYKKIKSIWKHSFRSRQKKTDHLEEQDSDEAGGSDSSDSSDRKPGSPRPEEKSPTGSVCSSEDIRDATKADLYSVPLEMVDVEDEDVAPEEKPSKPSSKPSTTSSSPPSEHHTEWSSVTEKDLYRDSTPETVADKDVIPEGVTQSFIEDNLVTEMDAKSKDIHLARLGSPFRREMSFTKMDSPSQEEDKDGCKSSPTVSTQGPCDSDRTEEKSSDRHGSKMYKKIKSIWKHSFRWRQKKMNHLETDPDLDETGGSDSNDLKSGSPRPEEKSPTGSVCSSEDIRDATKADLYSVPLEMVDVEDEDVAPEEKPSKLSSKPSITSSSPPAEHHTEKSSVTDKDLYRDSTPGTVADKEVTHEGVTKSFIEDNLVTEMDAKSKDIHLVTPGSPFLREMSFIKMDSPSQEDDKDVCKSSPTVSTQGPCDSDRTEEKSADRHGSKMYKKIKSIWKHSFRWRQKKMNHLETDPDLDETGGSDSNDLKSGSPRPEEKSPTGSMCSSEDIRDATKSDQRSVPLEEVDKVDEDVAPEEKPSKLSSKPSITSSSPPAEHHTEKSSVTDKDLYRDSTPGTVADKEVTHEGVTKSFIEDNLVTEMDAKSKDIHLVRPGSPFLREMSFIKMDSPSQDDDKDVCKSSPTVSTQGPCDSDRTEEKSADRHGSKMYKKIMSIWKHSFRWRQKKTDHLEEQDSVEAGGSDSSDSSDRKPGSPRPEEKSPTGSMCSSEDIRDATKADLYSVPLELVDVEDEDVAPEEKPSKPSSKPSTTSSSPPSEHHTEWSSVTEKDLYRDSTPGTVADKDVTPEGVTQSFIEDNLVTEMDAKSKDIHLARPGSPFLREMSFTKMDSPSQEKEKDVCKSSPTVSTQGPCDSDRTEEKSADRHGSKMYKKIKSIWKHSFRSRQKKMDHLETDPDLDEAGGSDNSDLKSGSPRPEEKSPTGSMYSSEDIRDATKSDLRSGPLEGVDVEDDDVTPEEKPSKPSSKPSTTSSSPPAEHHTERSSVTEKDINRDSTPGTVANKDVTPKGFMESINDNNLVTEMDATSKDTHLTKPGSRFPDDTSPTALMCCREDIRDTTKADLSSVPLELVDVEDEDITQVDHGEERSSDTKPSTTSSETEKDLYKDYFKGSQGDSSAAAEAQLTGLKNTLYTIIKGFFDNFTERQRSEMSNGVYNMDVKKKLVDFGTEVIRLIIEAITNMLSKPIDEFPPPYNMTKRGSAFSPVCGTETVGQNLPLQHFWENVTGQDNIQQSLKGSFGEAFTLAIVKSITDEVNPVLSETIQASLAGGTSNVHAATCCQFSTCGACKEMLAGVTQVMNSFLTGLGTASKKTIQTERTQKHSGHETKDDRVASAHHKKVHMKKSPCWSFGRKWRKNKVQPEAHLEEEVTDYRDSPLLFEMQNKDKKALSQDQAVQAKRPSLLKRFQLFYAPSMKM